MADHVPLSSVAIRSLDQWVDAWKTPELTQRAPIEGREKGLIEGKREALLRLLTKKFGPLSEDVTVRLRALEAVDELDVYLDRVLTATSLEEMELGARE